MVWREIRGFGGRLPWNSIPVSVPAGKLLKLSAPASSRMSNGSKDTKIVMSIKSVKAGKVLSSVIGFEEDFSSPSWCFYLKQINE